MIRCRTCGWRQSGEQVHSTITHVTYRNASAFAHDNTSNTDTTRERDVLPMRGTSVEQLPMSDVDLKVRAKELATQWFEVTHGVYRAA